MLWFIRVLILFLTFAALATLTSTQILYLLVSLLLFYLCKFTKKVKKLNLLGFMVLSLPILGSTVLVLVLLIYALINFNKKDLGNSTWSLPFIMTLLAGALAVSLVESSYASYLLFSAKSLSLSSIFIFVLYWGYFNQDQQRQEDFIKGILAGAVFALLIALLQLVYGPQFVLYPNSFWIEINRISSSLSDPNAFGVVCSLLLWIAFIYRSQEVPINKLFKFIVCLLFISSIFSGSRTVLIGFLVLVAAYCYLNHRKIFWGLIASAFLTVLAVNLVDIENFSLPIGIRRLVLSLSIPHLESSFSSRFTFLQLAFEAWLDAPVLGVGFGGFYYLVPEYGQILAKPIGLWMDNPNNLWLGFLVECGLFGVILLLLGVFSIKFIWANDDQRFIKIAAVLCFLFQLFFGPHIFFAEAAILFSLLLALCLNFEISKFRGLSKTSSVFIIFLVFIGLYLFQANLNSWGLYPYERDQQGVFRWARVSSQSLVNCDKDLAKLKVRFIPLDPLVQNFKIKTFFRQENFFTSKAEQEYSLTPNQSLEISEACSGLARFQHVAFKDFIPRDLGLGDDQRSLSFQIRYEQVPAVRYQGLFKNLLK
ncbi:MAG: O-antigen ligase family protein [Bdellovibrionota bacterium]